MTFVVADVGSAISIVDTTLSCASTSFGEEDDDNIVVFVLARWRRAIFDRISSNASLRRASTVPPVVGADASRLASYGTIVPFAIAMASSSLPRVNNGYRSDARDAERDSFVLSAPHSSGVDRR